jgi:hypothetical protein
MTLLFYVYNGCHLLLNHPIYVYKELSMDGMIADIPSIAIFFGGFLAKFLRHDQHHNDSTHQ